MRIRSFFKKKKAVECDILAFDFMEELTQMSSKELEITFNNVVDITKLEQEGKTEEKIDTICKHSYNKYKKEINELKIKEV